MLLGRDAERARIDALLERAREGTSGVLVIRGEAGIGKSALLEYAAGRAGAATVLRARGIESEVELAFAGLHELLRPVLGELDRLPAPQADALRGALGLSPAPAERHLAGAALLGLLAETEPVVLVDDAQWLDGPSAAALLFAARRLLADAVAVIVAVRSGEPSAFDGAGLDDLDLEGLPTRRGEGAARRPRRAPGRRGHGGLAARRHRRQPARADRARRRGAAAAARAGRRSRDGRQPHRARALPPPGLGRARGAQRPARRRRGRRRRARPGAGRRRHGGSARERRGGRARVALGGPRRVPAPARALRRAGLAPSRPTAARRTAPTAARWAKATAPSGMRPPGPSRPTRRSPGRSRRPASGRRSAAATRRRPRRSSTRRASSPDLARRAERLLQAARRPGSRATGRARWRCSARPTR